jgi:hypothetical protein
MIRIFANNRRRNMGFPISLRSCCSHFVQNRAQMPELEFAEGLDTSQDLRYSDCFSCLVLRQSPALWLEFCHHGALTRPVTAFLIAGQGLSDRSHHREQPSGGKQRDSASNEHGRPFSGTTEQPQPGLGGPRAGCVRPAAGRRFVMAASNVGRSVGAPSWKLVLDIHLESVLNAATGCAGMTALR